MARRYAATAPWWSPLARSARLGRESIWELEPQRLEEARRCLDRISAQWDAALGRLKAFVER